MDGVCLRGSVNNAPASVLSIMSAQVFYRRFEKAMAKVQEITADIKDARLREGVDGKVDHVRKAVAVLEDIVDRASGQVDEILSHGSIPRNTALQLKHCLGLCRRLNTRLCKIDFLNVEDSLLKDYGVYNIVKDALDNFLLVIEGARAEQKIIAAASDLLSEQVTAVADDIHAPHKASTDVKKEDTGVKAKRGRPPKNGVSAKKRELPDPKAPPKAKRVRYT